MYTPHVTSLLPEFLDFRKYAAAFTWDSHQSSVPDELSREEYQATNDPAVRDAWAEEARVIILRPELKIKYWEDAQLAASTYICEAYNITRFILGTYRKPVSYTNSKTERKAAFRKIVERNRTYTDGQVVDSLNEDLREAFHGMAWDSTSYLYEQLGERKGTEMNLAHLVCGVKIGLAEEFLFELRKRTTTASSD
jgi:hypothetical protein